MTTAAICAVVSFGIGSSWTVAGTIGVGLMGISVNMGLDPAITAGRHHLGRLLRRHHVAPVGFGQPRGRRRRRRTSTTTSANVLPISAGALAISLGIFWLLGSPGSFDATDKMRAIGSAFHISLVLFLPLVVVVVMALLKIPPFTDDLHRRAARAACSP